MPLTTLPEVGGDLGPVKVDRPDIPTGLTTFIYGAEWNVAAAHLEAVCEQVGLADGSTSGSLTARVDAVEATSEGRVPVQMTLVWSSVQNVDGVDHVSASYQRVGNYLDIEGELVVTPLSTGTAVATASLTGVVEAPAINRFGLANAAAGATIAPCAFQVNSTGAVIIVFEASDAVGHVVSFRLRYEAPV